MPRSKNNSHPAITEHAFDAVLLGDHVPHLRFSDGMDRDAPGRFCFHSTTYVSNSQMDHENFEFLSKNPRLHRARRFLFARAPEEGSLCASARVAQPSDVDSHDLD